MNTFKIDKKSTKLIAHAGLCGLETENTAAGFVAAGSRSYYGIETDVHVTKDRRIIALHNSNLLAMSGVDMEVSEHTLAELQSVPLYDRCFFNSMEDYGLQPQQGVHRADLRVPTLEDYINICKKYDKIAVPELKDPMTPEEIALVADTVRRLGYLDNTVFISFHWENLAALRSLLPQQTVQFLTGVGIDFTDAFLDRLAACGFDADIHIFTVTKELIDRFHARGIKVNVWTVDWPDRAEQVAGWGADYITTNILE